MDYILQIKYFIKNFIIIDNNIKKNNENKNINNINNVNIDNDNKNNTKKNNNNRYLEMITKQYFSYYLLSLLLIYLFSNSKNSRQNDHKMLKK